MGKGEGGTDRPALALEPAPAQSGERELKLSLTDGTPVVFRLLFSGESAGARRSYAKVGDPEIVVYGHRKDGQVSSRPMTGWHASVLLQGGEKLRESELLLRTYDERLEADQRKELTDWIRERMEGDADRARWHWVRVTLAAEEISSREHRGIPWQEITELDRRLAAEHGIDPQAHQHW